MLSRDRAGTARSTRSRRGAQARGEGRACGSGARVSLDGPDQRPLPVRPRGSRDHPKRRRRIFPPGAGAAEPNTPFAKRRRDEGSKAKAPLATVRRREPTLGTSPGRDERLSRATVNCRQRALFVEKSRASTRNVAGSASDAVRAENRRARFAARQEEERCAERHWRKRRHNDEPRRRAPARRAPSHGELHAPR